MNTIARLIGRIMHRVQRWQCRHREAAEWRFHARQIAHVRTWD